MRARAKGKVKSAKAVICEEAILRNCYYGSTYSDMIIGRPAPRAKLLYACNRASRAFYFREMTSAVGLQHLVDQSWTNTTSTAHKGVLCVRGLLERRGTSQPWRQHAALEV